MSRPPNDTYTDARSSAHVESEYAVAFFERRPDSIAVARMAPINTNINFPPVEAWGMDHDYTDFFNRPSDTRFSSSIDMGHAFAFEQPNANFAGSGAALKKLLMIPYSAGPMSLVCHKIGNTVYLDLDKDENDMYRKQLREKEIISSFPPSYNVLYDPNFPALSMYENLIWHSKSATDDWESSGSNHGTELALVDRPGGLFPRMFRSYSYRIRPQDNLNGEAYLWEFHDTRFLADTDLPIFGGGEFPGVTIRLSEEQKPISVLTGIDLMLDQLMVHVKETIVVYHSKGVVKEYDVVVQDEIPHLTGSEFDPSKLKSITENMYSFLSKNMTEQGHTYWLCRESGSDELKLYDLTALCPELASSSRWNPFLMPVIGLLYKLGSKLLGETMQCRSEKVSSVAYGLLTGASKLMKDEHYPGYDACIDFLTAGIYLTHGMTPSGERQMSQDHVLKGLDDVVLTSSYARMPAILKVSKLTKVDTDTPDDLVVPQKMPNSGPLADCCDQCLDHCLKALKSLEDCRHDEGSNDGSLFIPFVADTLDDLSAFESHKHMTDDTRFAHLRHCILLRAALAYTSLANHAMVVDRADKVFFHCKAGIQCVASVLSSKPAARHAAVCLALFPHLSASLLWSMRNLMDKVSDLSVLGSEQYRDSEIQKLATDNCRILEKYNYHGVWTLPQIVTYSEWTTHIKMLIKRCCTIFAEKWSAINKVQYFVVKEAVVSLEQAACRVASVCIDLAVGSTNRARDFFSNCEGEHEAEMFENCVKSMKTAENFYHTANELLEKLKGDECRSYQAMIVLNSVTVKRLNYNVLKKQTAPFKDIYNSADDILMSYRKAFDLIEKRVGQMADGSSMYTRALHDSMAFTLLFVCKEKDQLDLHYPGKKTLFLEAALRAKETLMASKESLDLSTRSGLFGYANCCHLQLLRARFDECKKTNFSNTTRSKEAKKAFTALLYAALRDNLAMYQIEVQKDVKETSLNSLDYFDLACVYELVSNQQKIELLIVIMKIMLAMVKEFAENMMEFTATKQVLENSLPRLQDHLRALLAVDRSNSAVKGAYSATLKKISPDSTQFCSVMETSLQHALECLENNS